jgi:hypothetical protein
MAGAQRRNWSFGHLVIWSFGHLFIWPFELTIWHFEKWPDEQMTK